MLSVVAFPVITIELSEVVKFNVSFGLSATGDVPFGTWNVEKDPVANVLVDGE